MRPGILRSEHSVTVILISLVCLLVYLKALEVGFLPLDEPGLVSWMQSPSHTWKSLFLPATNLYYRPLSMSSFLLEWNLWGLNPGMFHLTNILLHTANSLLVYSLALHLLRETPGRRLPALIAALVFALHPVNAETVVWVSSRYDLLSAFFFLVCLLLIVKKTDSASLPSLAGIFLSCLCALLSKEAAFALLPLVPLYFAANRAELPRRGMVRVSSALLAAFLLYLALRSGLAGTVDRGIASVLGRGAASPLTAAVDIFSTSGFYLRKLVWPFPLNFAITGIDRNLNFILFLIFIPLITLTFVRFRTSRLPLLIIIAGLAPPLLAVIGKIPWVPYAERYLYISSIGFALLAAALVAALPRKVPAVIPAACALLLAIPTASRVALWASPEAFWKDTVAKAPDFAPPRLALGCVLLEDGRITEAEREVRTAVSMGLKRDGDRESAENLFRAIAERSKGKEAN